MKTLILLAIFTFYGMTMTKAIDKSKPEPRTPYVHPWDDALGEGQSCKKTKDCQAHLECKRPKGKKCVNKPGYKRLPCKQPWRI